MSPSDRIGDDRLREILAGCEGVTAGPWDVDGEDNNDGRGRFTSYALFAVVDEVPRTIADTLNSDAAEIHTDGDCDGISTWDEQGRKNLNFLAMLDPQTVASIVSELLSHRERLAYRHDELVEAVSHHTKEPSNGK
jgi:hypothetical protein